MQVRTEDVYRQIETSKSLPSLPQVLVKLIEECNKEDFSVKDIIRIINTDPSLCSKVIRIVNSSYYSLSNKAKSIEQAIPLLGIDTIKSIAISASIYQVLDYGKGDDSLKQKAFWWHSLMCATLSRSLADKTGARSSDDAFLAGMLHDLGKLVLWANFPEEYGLVLKSSGSSTERLIGLEEQFGASHSRVGAWIIGRWKLPTLISDAVQFHHDPLETIRDSLPLVKIVYCANALCQYGPENETEGYRAAKFLFGFDEDQADAFVKQAEEYVEGLASDLGIDIERPDSEPPEDAAPQLTADVRDISLLFGLQESLLKAEDESAVLESLRIGLQVLFDLKSIAIFLYDPNKKTLQGATGALPKRDDHSNGIVFPAEGNKSLFERALFSKKPLDSFGQAEKKPLSILDKQIIRIMGEEGVVCIPVTAQKNPLGVIVLGVDAVLSGQLLKQSKLLTMIAGQGALALHVFHVRRQNIERIVSERLNASSDVAKKVIQELNTPLSIVKNYLSVMKKKAEEWGRLRTELTIIDEEIDQIALVVKNLTDFSEPRYVPTEAVDVNYLISDLVDVAKHSGIIGSDVHISLKIEPSLPPIDTSKNGLKQIVMSLLKNSGEAIGPGGRIGIQTRYLAGDDRPQKAGDSEETKGHIEIRISDDGPGIPDHIRAKVFEPFQTTKGDGHAGLGLTVVYNTVKYLHGDIQWHSDDKKGTVFTFRLPLRLSKGTTIGI